MDRLEELKVHKRHPDGVDFSNYTEGLFELIEYCKPKTMLEIGSYHGISTEVFLLHDIEVLAIDPLGIEPYSTEFLEKCSKYPNFSFIKGYSPKDLSMLKDNLFDLAYIDGEHDEDSVRADIQVSKRLVKPNGWITGHDFSLVANEVLKISDQVKQFSDDSWAIRNNK